ncbi:hypothetical protein N9A94_03330 [Akkermansiaceae bacterium]|nr:hypothetical protein [Akkermansiaceae bacterium]
MSARLRVDEWLKGKFFQNSEISPPGFTPVGEAVTALARPLKKLIENHRNTSRAAGLIGLRKEAHDIVISIAESTSAILEHWKILAGMDLIDNELSERAALDVKNLNTLRENLDAFRASFQKAAVSQSSDALAEATERLTEISHFTKLMSESIDDSASH